MISLCNGEEARVEHPQCRARGADRCVFVASWQ